MNQIDSTAPVVLRGRHVSLEPLHPGHSGALANALYVAVRHAAPVAGLP